METEVAAVNFSKLIQHIKPAETPVSFLIRDLPKNLISIVQNIYPYRWKGSLQYDPIATYQTQDKPVTPEAYNILADAIIQTAQFPEFYVLTASSHHLHEAGASAVQELAFLIASFVEYAHQLTERKVPVANIFSTAQFSVAVSTSYFTEIAKCRALRLLLAQLAGAYGINNYQAYIHVQTALWNKPSADAYNNIIRTTIEAMAAVAGGCDALTIAPYTVAFQKNSAFARRIARNISTILKEESYFDKVLNIASGAYYIEHLTHTFAQEAWQLFQTIERQGGIMQAFQSGFMNDSIKKVRLQREADLKSGKQVLVGVNKYKIQDEPAAPKEYFKKLYQK
jgi:methylmalonyl-CoA mutase